jgi:hypothetical protein
MCEARIASAFPASVSCSGRRLPMSSKQSCRSSLRMFRERAGGSMPSVSAACRSVVDWAITVRTRKSFVSTDACIPGHLSLRTRA